ncbi:MAG: GTP-dependent dephospho-CoA kinase family protein [Candidatus Bathyarchaeota archaeon]|nr:GTP-dependent dephospho-CoA kinase family protein [Candidatus Bathyarchaeota archaeon]
MTVAYEVTPELRVKFKQPFGVLIRGSFDATMAKMKAILEEEKPRIVSVGDRVTRNLHEHGINPQLSIIDNRCMRRKLPPENFSMEKVVHVSNPQGTITEEAIAAIREALETDKHVHIIVDGEEDLLTLVSVLYAPENSLVVYGQPYKGIVVVKVTPEKKAEAAEFLKAMKPVRKAK